jgi:POT family proton-dependent oligopeptide transporter
MSSESFFLIILAPILAVIYAKLQKIHKDPSPSIKTALSLLAMAACFFVMMIGSASIHADAASAEVSSSYLVGAYFLMAVGEMLLAPIGLSMVSRMAPPRFTGLAIGIWYACVGLAFYNGGLLAGFMNKMGGLFNFFSIFVAMTLVPAVIMFLFGKKLTKLSHVNATPPQSFTDIDK